MVEDDSGRVQTRINLKVAVRVQHHSRLQEFYSRNLSSGGIFLELPSRPPPVGTEMTLTFQVPVINRTFTVKGEIMHQHIFETTDATFKRKVLRYGIGLRFVDLTDQDQKLIQEYVSGKDLHVNRS
jgi:hypothetical protein